MFDIKLPPQSIFLTVLIHVIATVALFYFYPDYRDFDQRAIELSIKTAMVFGWTLLLFWSAPPNTRPYVLIGTNLVSLFFFSNESYALTEDFMNEVGAIGFWFIAIFSLGLVLKKPIWAIVFYCTSLTGLFLLDQQLIGEQELLCGQQRTKELRIIAFLEDRYWLNSGMPELELKGCKNCQWGDYVEYERIALFMRAVDIDWYEAGCE